MRDLLKEKLSSMNLPTDNCHVRKILKGKKSVCLFEDNFNNGDFYFIPVHEEKPAEYYDGRLTIYCFRNPDKTDFYEIEGKNMYLSDIDNAVLIYDDLAEIETKLVSAYDGSNRSHTTLSAREYACIHLKVPHSGTDWLDSLIKDSK